VTAPAGAVVRIFYDGPELVAGHFLRTATGRTYLVVSVRVQRRGRHTGRQHLACLVTERGPTVRDHVEGRVHPLHWYPRG
jgi:hypothetical protein